MAVLETNRPLRVLERAIQGGLGGGNLGLIASRHGTGKVAVLTTIAIDHAIHEKKTLTVAVGQTVDGVRVFHDEVYDQIRRQAEGPVPDALAVERHKQIYAYPQGTFSVSRLRETLTLLRDHADFVPEMIEIQGWPDFEAGDPHDEVADLKTLASDLGTAVWIACHTHRGEQAHGGIPESAASVAEYCSVVLTLEEAGDHVDLQFAKTPNGEASSLRLEFDPKTMMLRWR